MTARAHIPITCVDDAQRLVGAQLGPTDWFVADADVVNRFAQVVLDPQWSQGRTTVPGSFVLALGPNMVREILNLEGVRSSVNYGCNFVRFPAPMPVGSRVRMWLLIGDVVTLPQGCRVTLTCRFECERRPRSPCVAQVISQWTFVSDRDDGPGELR